MNKWLVAAVAVLLGWQAANFLLPADAKKLKGPLGGPLTGAVCEFIEAGIFRCTSLIGKVTTQLGTAYTFSIDDCGTQVNFTNGSSVTTTIPARLPVGCNIVILQAGSGTVSVAGTAVPAATLFTHVASSAATGTAGQWAVIGITIEANLTEQSAVAVLTGDGA